MNKAFVTIGIDAETGECTCDCGTKMKFNLRRQSYVCPKCNASISRLEVAELLGKR